MEIIAKSLESSFTETTDEREFFRSGTQCKKLLKRLRDREDLCDVDLIAGETGKRISAHRMILIASCDYFSALLSGPMRESQEREIILKEVDGESLQKIVNYCYTGSLELRRDTVESLITTANYLQLIDITEACCEFLQRHLEPSNCLDVVFFAEQLNLDVLLHKARKFICEKFELVSECPKLLLLNAKQLSKIISSNELDVESEEVVFRVLMKWIEYEPENRKKHFTELLAHVRLPLLSFAFLFETVEPLCSTTESMKLFINALKPNKLCTSNAIVLRNRQSKCVDNLFAIYNNPNERVTIVGYNIHSNQWTTWKTLNDCRHDFAVALMDEPNHRSFTVKLIIAGGLAEHRYPSNKVKSLTLQTMASTEMALLSTIRSEHSVAVLNGSIYVVGGYDGRQSLSSVERWDPVSRTWSFVAPMQTARRNFGMAVINDRLYASGGTSNGTTSSSMECYDPLGNVWKFTAPMKSARSSHCLVAHKNYLFAIGGNNGHLERYDLSIDTWTPVFCSPTINDVARCVSLGSDIFIYNNFNFYMMNRESSQLKILSKPPVNSRTYCIALFRTPMELLLNKIF